MKPEKLVFPLFLLVALIAFYPTIGAGFVYDFLGWQGVYDKGNFSDILHSFGYMGNHQLLHFFFYSLYSLFHIKGLPWYLIFTTLHACNGWLMYTWLRRLGVQWHISSSPVVVLLICLLFLLHPYTIEPVVWKACIHYLLSFTALLSLMLLMPEYISRGKSKALRLAFLVYIASLFLLEISFVTPLWITIWLLVWSFRTKRQDFPWRRAFRLAGGLWILLGLYILLNRFTIGAWVGHYGAESHFRFDLLGIVSTEIKYLVKHVFLARYYSFYAKDWLFDRVLSSPELVFMIMTVCMGLVILYLIRRHRLAATWHLGFLGLSGSLLYILPVSNLFFFHLQVGMNDRYSYIPLVFLLLALYAWISVWPRRLILAGLGVLLALQLYFHIKTTSYWKTSAAIIKELRDTFRWHDNSHVFVLNAPDNHKGIVMVSIIGDPSGIEELIDYQTPRPFAGVMYDVFQFNMNSPDEGVVVEQTGPMQLKVTFSQWGNWWHFQGIGASSYENEYYIADMQGHHYNLTFKQFPEGSAIIYHQGTVWKEFFFNAWPASSSEE